MIHEILGDSQCRFPIHKRDQPVHNGRLRRTGRSSGAGKKVRKKMLTDFKNGVRCAARLDEMFDGKRRGAEAEFARSLTVCAGDLCGRLRMGEKSILQNVQDLAFGLSEFDLRVRHLRVN